MIDFFRQIHTQYSKSQPLYRKLMPIEQIRLCERWTEFELLKKVKSKGLIAFVPRFPESSLKRMELVELSKLRTFRMVVGNEKRYSKVVHRGLIKEWVGIGWIDIDNAKRQDYFNYPVVV